MKQKCWIMYASFSINMCSNDEDHIEDNDNKDKNNENNNS